MTDVQPRKKYQRPDKLPVPIRSEYQPTAEERKVIFGRIEGFIRDDGSRYALRHLLAEAYIQGMRDTLDAQKERT